MMHNPIRLIEQQKIIGFSNIINVNIYSTQPEVQLKSFDFLKNIFQSIIIGDGEIESQVLEDFVQPIAAMLNVEYQKMATEKVAIERIKELILLINKLLELAKNYVPGIVIHCAKDAIESDNITMDSIQREIEIKFSNMVN